jgi:hypothetical protein
MAKPAPQKRMEGINSLFLIGKSALQFATENAIFAP